MFENSVIVANRNNITDTQVHDGNCNCNEKIRSSHVWGNKLIINSNDAIGKT